MLRLIHNNFLDKYDIQYIDYILKILPDNGNDSVYSLIRLCNNNDYDTYHNFTKLLYELPKETTKVKFADYLHYMKDCLLNDKYPIPIQEYFDKHMN